MTKAKTPQHEFHKLSTGFPVAAGRRGTEWWLNINSDRFQSASICEGKSLPPFGPGLFADAEDPAPREDFPHVSDPAFVVVSQRARAVIESEAAGNCQFLPIDIKHKGHTIDSSYSIVNCLRRLDCIDRERSSRWLVGQKPQIYMRVEIDPSRVPPDVAAFRAVGHDLCLFMRERVREAFRKAKLTGWTAWQG